MAQTPRFRTGTKVLLLTPAWMGLVIPALARSPQEAKAKVSQAALSNILKATGDYCEVVKRMALYFVCLERIREQENFFTRGSGAGRSSPDALKVAKSKTRTFVYEYQIIKKKDDVSEKRDLIEENGRKRKQEDAELPTLKFSGRNLVYGPVGFLSSYWQNHFSYEILGEEDLGGKRAVVVRAVPNTDRQENNNHGRVWVDAATYRILRLELEPQTLEDSEVNFDGAKSTPGQYAKVNGGINVPFHRHLTWTIDYGVEKKSALFPTRQTIREWYLSDMGYRIVKREVVFDYTDYKFFTVDVEVR